MKKYLILTVSLTFLLTFATSSVMVAAPQPGVEVVPERVVVELDPETSAEAFARGQGLGAHLHLVGQWYSFKAPTRTEQQARALVEALKKTPHVLDANLVYLVPVLAEPNDPYWPAQSTLHPMTDESDRATIQNRGAMWDVATGSSSISVGIIDEGFDTTHPDLPSDRVDWSRDYWTYHNECDPPGQNCSEDPTYVRNDWPCQDDDTFRGHGTSVWGILGTRGNNGTGVAGVNWNGVRFGLAKASQDGYCASLALDYAVAAITDLTNQGMDIISMSWGSDLDYGPLRSAVQNAYNNGVLLVAAAGNSGLQHVIYPAGYLEVVAVGGFDTDHQGGFDRAISSNYGDHIEVMGHMCAYTTTETSEDPDYETFCGTSAATPNVAGIAALAWGYRTSLTRDEVRSWLGATAEDIDTDGWDIETGYGMADGYNLLKRLQGGQWGFELGTLSQTNYGVFGAMILKTTDEHSAADPPDGTDSSRHYIRVYSGPLPQWYIEMGIEWVGSDHAWWTYKETNINDGDPYTVEYSLLAAPGSNVENQWWHFSIYRDSTITNKWIVRVKDPDTGQAWEYPMLNVPFTYGSGYIAHGISTPSNRYNITDKAEAWSAYFPDPGGDTGMMLKAYTGVR